MKTLTFLSLLALAQGDAFPKQVGSPPPAIDEAQPAATDDSVSEGQPELPEVEPYEGTLAQGLGELETFAVAGELDRSLELADRLLAPNSFLRWRQDAMSDPESLTSRVLRLSDPLLESLGLLGAPAADRAEVHYAKGVVLARKVEETQDPEGLPAVEQSFQSSRALAGGGELRLDSIYNLGAGVLQLAEAVRLTIPEVREKLGLPALPPTTPPTVPPVPGAPPQAQPEEAPDPLEIARAFYLESREHFVEHLRVDWRDEDTRANVELIQRRLKELDEIEKQREEQEQEQQQEQEQEQDQNQDPNQDQQEQDQDGEQQEDQENQDPQEQDPENQDEPQEQEQDEEEDEPEEPEEQEGEEGEQQPSEQQPQPQPTEEFLTREEVMRLLERLEGIEEEAAKVEAQLKDSRRVPVRRDW